MNPDVTSAVHEPGEALIAVILQITEHAERLAVLDEREAAHHRQVATRLTQLARQLTDTAGHLSYLRDSSARQAALTDSLDSLDQQIGALATRLTAITADRHSDHADGDKDTAGESGDTPHRPGRAVRWWKLTGQERDQQIVRLRAWVDQVYRPGYGHLAAGLGSCWEEHPLCLYGLDWLMELWSALYLNPDRDPPVLASQAELQTRLLPGLAGQMHRETTRCAHARSLPARRHPPPPSDPAQRPAEP
jgi:hypothetical protein